LRLEALQVTHDDNKWNQRTHWLQFCVLICLQSYDRITRTILLLTSPTWLKEYNPRFSFEMRATLVIQIFQNTFLWNCYTISAIQNFFFTTRFNTTMTENEQNETVTIFICCILYFINNSLKQIYLIVRHISNEPGS